MTVLVTGATGFLGSRLAHRLAAAGDDVRVLVRPTSDRRRLAGVPVTFAEGDVTDRRSVDDAVDRVEAVFHVAARYELGTPDPAAMARTNVGGTANVLEAAAARGIAAVHVSSTAALGPTGAAPADESHWTDRAPRSPYEATKREAHEVARRLAAQGAPVRIASPVTIYGPDDPSLVGRFHALAARWPLPIGALGDLTMSLVHVDDCAEGVLRVGRAPAGSEYVLSGGPVTFREWFGAIARATGRRRPVAYVPPRVARAATPLLARLAPLAGLSPAVVREGMALADGAHWAYSGDRARRELGWEPRPLDTGLAETLAWYAAPTGAGAETTRRRA